MIDKRFDRIGVGLCRAATYGLLGPADVFLPVVRRLGGRIVRITLFWSQLEPSPGEYDWSTLDAFLHQLDGDEAWITVASSSTWGTKIASSFLPPSPAIDHRRYTELIEQMVRRAAGRVPYWQCEIEPTVGLMWSGSADEYLVQLGAFSAAVRTADPDALVVLGAGVPAAMVAGAPGHDQRASEQYSKIVREGLGDVDVLDLHPYGDPYAIDALVATARKLMDEAGQQKPIVAGEYNGPLPTTYRANLPALVGVLASFRRTFADARVEAGGLGSEPDDPAVIDLYADRESLPDTLQMFLSDAPDVLRSLLHRESARDLVIRSALLLAAGVRRLLPFAVAPEYPDATPYTTRALMFGAFAMADFEDGRLGRMRPVARTFEFLARALNGVATAYRFDCSDPDLFLINCEASDGAPAVAIAWTRSGSKQQVRLPWQSASPLHGVDAIGAPVPIEAQHNHPMITVGDLPVLVRTTN